jgi:hypothetical protein
MASTDLKCRRQDGVVMTLLRRVFLLVVGGVFAACGGGSAATYVSIPAHEDSPILTADEAMAQSMLCGGHLSESCGQEASSRWTPDASGHGLYAVKIGTGAGGCSLSVRVYFFDDRHLLADTSTLPPKGRADVITAQGPGKFSVSYIVWLTNPPPNDIGCGGVAPASPLPYLYSYNGSTMVVAKAPPLPSGDTYSVVNGP